MAKEAGAKAKDAFGKQLEDGNTKAMVQREEAKVTSTPLVTATPSHLQPRERIASWRATKASKEVLQCISQGVMSNLYCPQMSLYPTVRPQEDLKKVGPLIREYLEVGALRGIPFSAEIKNFRLHFDWKPSSKSFQA